MLPPSSSITRSSWSVMLPELLRETICRVEDTEDHWTQCRDVVPCLKLPGLRDYSNQCLTKRNKRHQPFSRNFLEHCLTSSAPSVL
ncbi:hypothetical protein Bca101_058808 [Brassica carinata]